MYPFVFLKAKKAKLYALKAKKKRSAIKRSQNIEAGTQEQQLELVKQTESSSYLCNSIRDTRNWTNFCQKKGQQSYYKFSKLISIDTGLKIRKLFHKVIVSQKHQVLDGDCSIQSISYWAVSNWAFSKWFTANDEQLLRGVFLCFGGQKQIKKKILNKI